MTEDYWQDVTRWRLVQAIIENDARVKWVDGISWIEGQPHINLTAEGKRALGQGAKKLGMTLEEYVAFLLKEIKEDPHGFGPIARKK